MSFESNSDASTTISVRPAYRKTLIGRLFIDVEYAVQSLWHGVYFPKAKRRKFYDRWCKTNGSLGGTLMGGGRSSVETTETPAGLNPSSSDMGAMGAGNREKESKWSTMIKEFRVGGQIDAAEVAGWQGSGGVMRGLEADARFALRGSVDFATPPVMKYDADFAHNLSNDDGVFLRHVDDVFVQMTFEHESVERLGEAIIVDTRWSLTTGWKKTEEFIAQVQKTF